MAHLVLETKLNTFRVSPISRSSNKQKTSNFLIPTNRICRLEKKTIQNLNPAPQTMTNQRIS